MIGLPEIWSDDPLVNIVNRMWGPFYDGFDKNVEGKSTFLPPSDIVEDDKRWTLAIDLPGVDIKDVTVDLQGDHLLVKAKRTTESEVKEGHYHRLERRSGTYQRHFSLPDNVDGEDLTAKMQDGVLRIAIGKKELEEKRVKQIPVQAG